MYFDYSASCPITKDALNTYIDASKLYANPQSMHQLGIELEELIEASSKRIKELLNVPEHNLTYTQNASHANKVIIDSIIDEPSKQEVIMAPFEHSSVVSEIFHKQRQGLIIHLLKVDRFGKVDLKDLKNKINDKTKLIILAGVDSELGIIQDIDAIIKIKKDIPLFSDMTQAIGKHKFNLNQIDYISFSSHKFYGPKGIGGILSKENICVRGTLSYPLIKACEVALTYTLKQDEKYVTSLNKYFKDKLKELDINYNSPDDAIPHLINLSLDDKGIDLTDYFSGNNLHISQGSACNKKMPSRSIIVLGKSKTQAMNSIRISLSHLSTYEEVDKLCEVIINYYENY